MKDGTSEKIKHWVQLFLAVSAAVGIIYGFLSSIKNNIITEKDLQLHNTDDNSHPIIVKNLEVCEGKVESLSKRIEEAHEVEIALGAKLVRILAADMESNRNLKAAAANYYEQEFRHKIRKGLSIEEALLESLREPYYGRPRIR